MSENTEKKRSILMSLVRVFALLTIIAVVAYFFVLRPNMIIMQQKSKRSELPVTIKSIKTALTYYHDMENKYISIDAYPKNPGAEAKPWKVEESGGFQTIGFSYDFGSVYGSYWVDASETDFTVYGISDIDGDGVFATYTATKNKDPELLNTDNDVF